MGEFHVPNQYPTITAAYNAARATVLLTATPQLIVIEAGDYFDFPSVVDVDGINFLGPYTGTANIVAIASFNQSLAITGTLSNSVSNLSLTGIRLLGTNFQSLSLNNVKVTNNDSDALVMSNTGVSTGTNKYSFVKSVNCSFVANTGMAVVVSGGFVDATSCSFVSPTNGISAWVDFATLPETDKVSGLKAYQGSFTGQVKAHYGLSNIPEDKYFILNLDRVSIKTTGAGYSCVSVEDASVRLTNVTLNNPQAPINIAKTGNSFVAYSNLIIPAGTVPPNFSTMVPRSRIETDVANAGGVLVNDSYGKITSVLGNLDGQSLTWSDAKGTWIASLSADTIKFYDFYVSDISVWFVGDVVALSSSGPVLAQNDTESNSTVVGIVHLVTPSETSSGGTITVVMAGQVYLNTNLSMFALGETVYVGSLAGKVVRYSDIPNDGRIVAVGVVINPSNNTIAYQPRLIGIK